jgi:hypothetical protein
MQSGETCWIGQQLFLFPDAKAPGTLPESLFLNLLTTPGYRAGTSSPTGVTQKPMENQANNAEITITITGSNPEVPWYGKMCAPVPIIPSGAPQRDLHPRAVTLRGFIVNKVSLLQGFTQFSHRISRGMGSQTMFPVMLSMLEGFKRKLERLLFIRPFRPMWRLPLTDKTVQHSPLPFGLR